VVTVTPANRKRFERLGVATVRLDLQWGVFVEPGDDRNQALEWLAEQDRATACREAFKYRAMLILTLVAAVAACIAAWPVVKG
jgi:hypothetical protein